MHATFRRVTADSNYPNTRLPTPPIHARTRHQRHRTCAHLLFNNRAALRIRRGGDAAACHCSGLLCSPTHPHPLTLHSLHTTTEFVLFLFFRVFTLKKLCKILVRDRCSSSTSPGVQWCASTSLTLPEYFELVVGHPALELAT
jgi:hypothetical protein